MFKPFTELRSANDLECEKDWENVIFSGKNKEEPKQQTKGTYFMSTKELKSNPKIGSVVIIMFNSKLFRM